MLQAAAWISTRLRSAVRLAAFCHGLPAVDQTPDQAANRRNSPPLQAPGRTDAGLAAQEQSDVAGGRLDQHALADILVTAHPHATHTARLIQVRESPLHHLAPAPLQATTPPPPHTTPVPIQSLLCRSLLRRLLSRLLVLPAAPTALRLRYVTPNPYRVERHQRRVAVIALYIPNDFTRVISWSRAGRREHQ